MRNILLFVFLMICVLIAFARYTHHDLVTQAAPTVIHSPSQPRSQIEQLKAINDELGIAKVEEARIEWNNLERATQKSNAGRATEAWLKSSEKSSLNIGVAMRQNFASNLEEKFLDIGLDTHVTASGPQKRALNIKCILADRVMAHKVMTDEAQDRMQKLGFKTVRFEGLNQTWTYKY